MNLLLLFLTLFDDYVSTNNVKFYFDYQDGEYGYNTSPLRGADTFSPFKSGSEVVYIGGNRATAMNSNGWGDSGGNGNTVYNNSYTMEADGTVCAGITQSAYNGSARVSTTIYLNNVAKVSRGSGSTGVSYGSFAVKTGDIVRAQGTIGYYSNTGYTLWLVKS